MDEIIIGFGWRGKTEKLTPQEIPSWANEQPFRQRLPDDGQKKDGIDEPKKAETPIGAPPNENASADEQSSSNRLQVEADCKFVCIYCCRPELRAPTTRPSPTPSS